MIKLGASLCVLFIGALVGHHFLSQNTHTVGAITTTVDAQIPVSAKKPAGPDRKDNITGALKYFKKKTGTTPHEMFLKILKQATNNTKQIKFYYTNSLSFNAYATRSFTHRDEAGNMVISQIVALHAGTMFMLADNPDGLAFILGHEIAHHLLAHLDVGNHPFREYLTSRHKEKMADILGVQLAGMAGYNKCGAYKVWQMLDKRWKETYCPVSHPSYSERVAYLQAICGR